MMNDKHPQHCYVIGTLAADRGYISAVYDPEKGNQPVLTGNPAKAYLYESPKSASHACRHLQLDSLNIYAGSPTEELQCPPARIIPMNDQLDKEVVIQTPEGLYLYRDGKTLGDSPTHACKYRLYADNVEQQLQQIKTELGETWKWVEYSKL